MFIFLPSIENPEFDSIRERNISRLPIPKRDEILIIWEIERKHIRPITVPGQVNDENVHTFLPIPDHLKLDFLELDPESQIQFNSTLLNRNSLVVEYKKIYILKYF